MRFPHVKLIAAIGNYGQIGLNSRLPWHCKEDLQHFRRITMGGICIVGRNTFKTLPPLPGRDVIVWRRHDGPEEFARAHTDRDIWICGGAGVYREWLPFVSMTVLTHIDYDDKADVYMPHLWKLPKPKKVPVE